MSNNILPQNESIDDEDELKKSSAVAKTLDKELEEARKQKELSELQQQIDEIAKEKRRQKKKRKKRKKEQRNKKIAKTGYVISSPFVGGTCIVLIVAGVPLIVIGIGGLMIPAGMAGLYGWHKINPFLH